MRSTALLVMGVLGCAACAGPRSNLTWYEARCVDQYAMRQGTSEFEACVSRERGFVEETQARADRIRP